MYSVLLVLALVAIALTVRALRTQCEVQTRARVLVARVLLRSIGTQGQLGASQRRHISSDCRVLDIRLDPEDAYL